MSKGPRIASKPIAELVEQINLLIYSSNVARGLKPSQWAALRFFDQASPNVRSVSGFAEMNFTTNGSASQTITTLVSKKCLERIPDEADGRRHSLQVTKLGKKLLADDPINTLAGAIGDLSATRQGQLAEIITSLYRDVYVNREDDE